MGKERRGGEERDEVGRVGGGREEDGKGEEMMGP